MRTWRLQFIYEANGAGATKPRRLGVELEKLNENRVWCDVKVAGRLSDPDEIVLVGTNLLTGRREVVVVPTDEVEVAKEIWEENLTSLRRRVFLDPRKLGLIFLR